MNEIYWLTRLDSLQTLFAWCLGVGIFIVVISAIACILNKIDYDESQKEWEEFFKKKFRWSIPMIVCGALGCCLIPSTKDAFLIWGVGGSIDYLKENPTAKQLPDKVINILDEWIDELAPEKGKNK